MSSSTSPTVDTRSIAARDVVHATHGAPRLLHVRHDATSPSAQLFASRCEREPAGASVEQAHPEFSLQACHPPAQAGPLNPERSRRRRDASRGGHGSEFGQAVAARHVSSSHRCCANLGSS